MKKFVLNILFFFLSISCKKEEVIIYESGNTEFGKATANKNGKKWAASVYATIHDVPYQNYFLLHFNTYEQGIYLRETLSTSIPLSIGKYNLIKDSYDYLIDDGKFRASYGLSEDDGDVQGEYYILSEQSNNSLEITYMDTINGIVHGKFNALFLVKEPKKNIISPECVQFTDGEFEAIFQ